LEFCYECQDFPCSRLNEWAKGSKRYEKAVGRLKEMKKGKESSPEEMDAGRLILEC